VGSRPPILPSRRPAASDQGGPATAVPGGRALTGALLYGELNFGAAFALAYYALVRLHAGLGQTLLALVPLATLLLAVARARSACDSRRSSAPYSRLSGSL
jgi:drug/metabolite transporter (DMT)-like permease